MSSIKVEYKLRMGYHWDNSIIISVIYGIIAAIIPGNIYYYMSLSASGADIASLLRFLM